MLRKETISPFCLTLLQDLMTLPELQTFRLAGGTALSLQYGHRISVDLDIFTDRSFDLDELEVSLRQRYPTFIKDFSNRLGFSGYIDNVKTDFVNWSVPFIRPVIEIENVRLASPIEIAAMKMETITSRQMKKDYYDIYELLKYYSIAQLFDFYRERYPYNNPKAPLEFLVAAHLADESPEPEMLFLLEWDKVKSTIRQQTQSYIEDLKNKKVQQEADKLKDLEERIKKMKGKKD
jgi:Nucleotidyl transferase AbiEii toxin, Type IV TA system